MIVLLFFTQVEDALSDRADIRQKPDEPAEKPGKYIVYLTETTNRLHVNVEELDRELQAAFVEKYLETFKKHVDCNEVLSISFNYINENVFRSQLNMPIRNLGFISSFERYNDDRGIAIFKAKSHQLEDVDSRRIGSYHRMAYTKSRKTDILNLTM